MAKKIFRKYREYINKKNIINKWKRRTYTKQYKGTNSVQGKN